MSGRSLKFGDKTTKNSDFCNNKKSSNIDNIDVDKILISKTEPDSNKENSYKFSIGYNDNDVIRPLFLKLPQMIEYLKCFENNKKSMSFKFNVKKMYIMYINKYNWGGINFLSEKDIWKKFKKNIVTIALNVLYAKKEIMYPAYLLKHHFLYQNVL